MPLDLRRYRQRASAGRSLLALELRVLTGNQAIVLAVVQLVYFTVITLMVKLGDDDWRAASFYNSVVVLPSLVPAIALGMVAVMGDRDSRQLEVTFVARGGRYQVWIFRLCAIAGSCAASALVLSALAWAILDHDHRPVAAFLHALFPIVFVVVLAMGLSVTFNGAAVAGLVTTGFLGVSFVLLHGGPLVARRFDVFFNPFDQPQDLLDPAEWFRAVVFNRSLLLALAGLALAGTLLLVQRRERLL